MARKSLTGFDFQSQKGLNIASGTNPSDAVNLAQLNAAINGLSWKSAVRAATTTNLTISAPGATIDGVTMTTGDRFLGKNQTTGTENGIYVWNGASSAATRAADANSATNFVDNTTVYVSEGTVNADTAWTCTNNGTITPGTTSIAFAQVGAQVAYTAAPSGGLSLSGTAFSIDTTIVPRKYSANVGDGSSSTITVTHNLNTLDVIIQVRDASTGEVVEVDEGNGRTVNAVPLTFATAPASNAYRVTVIG